MAKFSSWANFPWVFPKKRFAILKMIGPKKSLLIHDHNTITTISLSTKIMRFYATIKSLEDVD